MKCQKCEELLSEYIDERLDALMSAEVAAHLAECRTCGESEAKLRATIALVGGLDRKTAPLDFGELAAAKLERRMLLDGKGYAAKRHIISPWRFTGIGVLAAAVILIVCYVMIPPVKEEHTASYDRVAMDVDKDFTGGAVVERKEEAPVLADRLSVNKSAAEVPAGITAAAEQTRAYDSSAAGAAGGRVASNAASGGGGSMSAAAPAQVTAELAQAKGDAVAMPALAREEEKATVTTLGANETAKLKSLGYIGDGAEKPAEAARPVAVAVDSEVISKLRKRQAQNAPEASLMFSNTEAVAPVTIEFDGDVSAPVEKLMSLLGGADVKVGTTVMTLDEVSKAASAAGVTIVEMSADKAVVEFKCVPERTREITEALKQAFAPALKAPADAKHVEGYVIEGPTTNQPAFDSGVTVDRDGDTESEPTVTRLVFVRRKAGAGGESAP